MTYEITRSKGHYEIFIDDRFYCTADTYPEAEREIQSYISERTDANETNNQH